MKKEKYIVEIEMPDGDGASSVWVKDVLQSDADIEDEGRWKVSVIEQWKPSEEQINALAFAVVDSWSRSTHEALKELFEQLKAL